MESKKEIPPTGHLSAQDDGSMRNNLRPYNFTFLETPWQQKDPNIMGIYRGGNRYTKRIMSGRQRATACGERRQTMLAK